MLQPGKVKVITCDVGEQTRNVTIIEGERIVHDGEVQTAYLLPQGATTQTEEKVIEEDEVQTQYYTSEDMKIQTDIKEFREFEVQSETPY